MMICLKVKKEKASSVESWSRQRAMSKACKDTYNIACFFIRFSSEDLPSTLEKLDSVVVDSNLTEDGMESKSDELSPTAAEISGLKHERDDVGDDLLELQEPQRHRTEDDKKSDFQPPLPQDGQGNILNRAPITSDEQQQQDQEAATELDAQPQTSPVDAPVPVGGPPVPIQNFGNPTFMAPVVAPMAAFQPPPYMPQPFLVNPGSRGFQQWQPQFPPPQFQVPMQQQPDQIGEVPKSDIEGLEENGDGQGQEMNQQPQEQSLDSSQNEQPTSQVLLTLPPGQQFLQPPTLQGDPQAVQLPANVPQSITETEGTGKEENGTNGGTGPIQQLQQQQPLQGVPQQQSLPPNNNGAMYYPPPMFPPGAVPMQPHGMSDADAAAFASRSRMMFTQFPPIPPGMMAPAFMLNGPGGAMPPNIVPQRYDPSSASAAATGFMGQPVVVPARTNGITLSLSCDEEQLSEYQILVRKQLEIFEATQEDVESNTQGRKKQVTLGQVGIRCR